LNAFPLFYGEFVVLVVVFQTMKARMRVILGLVLGLLTGLLLGWLFLPLEYVDTDPSSLREDFHTDYVLMTAEAYAGEGDIQMAQIRLAALGPQPPSQIVADAIAYAEQSEFGQTDLQVLNQLAVGLRSFSPTAEIEGP
jgi:hypothetical protein